MRLLLFCLFLLSVASYARSTTDEIDQNFDEEPLQAYENGEDDTPVKSEAEEKYSDEYQVANDQEIESQEREEDEIVKNDAEEKEEDEKLLIPKIDPQRIKRVLENKDLTRKMIDCVIYFEDGCPQELEKVNRMAPEIFRRGGNCFQCSKQDRTKLRHFLVQLQRHQPSEYRRMIRELGLG